MGKHVWVIGALLAAVLTGCASPTQRLAAQATARDRQPMVEWVAVQPEHLAGISPDRLRAEGVALLIFRALRETPAGERLGAPDGVALRNVSSSTIRTGMLKKAGDESEIGWGVMIVPPGQYAINRSTTQQVVRYSAAGVRSTTSDVNGHPYVPLSATIRVSAGEVVYVGTLVWQTNSAAAIASKVRVRDEKAAAERWVATHLPDFAGTMQVRILMPAVEPLS